MNYTNSKLERILINRYPNQTLLIQNSNIEYIILIQNPNEWFRPGTRVSEDSKGSAKL